MVHTLFLTNLQNFNHTKYTPCMVPANAQRKLYISSEVQSKLQATTTSLLGLALHICPSFHFNNHHHDYS